MVWEFLLLLLHLLGYSQHLYLLDDSGVKSASVTTVPTGTCTAPSCLLLPPPRWCLCCPEIPPFGCFEAHPDGYPGHLFSSFQSPLPSRHLLSTS